MSARIFDLSEMVAVRLQTVAASAPTSAPTSTLSRLAGEGVDSVAFWTGASGRRYVHSVFDLVTCPELPSANYVLVRRGRDGSATVLRVGVVDHYAPSLNRAELRHRAARLGANEVHLHLIADGAGARAAVRIDLAAGQTAPAAVPAGCDPVH